ncbi:MAG: 23S rRNA (uracil(1939)-C(5))-methyltransferase RlmD [Eggerthellaceae bacterium]|nr:23S rRNA (uracil(1939)-C(5))-methyltransferase RlmD [Eggerthellaceae bacterium]
MDLPYEKQLASKQEYIEKLFEGVAPREAVRPILGMEEPFHYRNKVISPYAPGKKLSASRPAGKGSAKTGAGKGSGKNALQREILTGMYAKGTHKLVPTDTCLLENQVAKKITLVVRDLMARFGIEPYNEDTGAGFMRHAVVRVGHESGEVLVTLVTNGDTFPASKAFCRELVKRVPQVTTVVQNINTRQTNVILGDQERTLYGPGFILDTLCGLSFRISSHSFYQVNATQTEILYEAAIALAGFDGTQTAIDAYCGTGTIGLVAAKRGAARVIGVDNVASAIADARLNARHNGVENAEFVAADAGAFMRELAADRAGLSSVEDLVLLMDPPRAGSTPEVLDAAIAMAPSCIVYISCNPETQVRDVRYLAQAGYQIEVLQAVDMFPHTEHVESIALITRGEK